MKIGAVSSLSSNQQVDPVVLALLKKLGLTSSGNQQIDIQNIKKATQEQGQESGAVSSFSEIDKVNKASTQVAAPNGQPAWMNLMQELGLQPTGSKEGDMAAVSQKISALESRAVTKEEKVQIAAYKAEFSSCFGVSMSGTKSVDDLLSTQQINPSAGLEQIAELNKHFLVKYTNI